MKKLSIKEQKAVVMKIQGKKNKDIAKELYPDQNGNTASVSISRLLKKANVQDALQVELIKQGISIERVLKPINKALDAKIVKSEKVGETVTTNDDGSKSIEYEYIEVEEDNLPLQLQASDRASKLLGLTGNDAKDNGSGLSPEELQALANASSEVELTRLLFRKDQ